MGLFKQKTKHVVGLDISSTSVKLVELSRNSNGYQVESFASKLLPAGAVVEKNITDVDLVADTVRKVVALAKPRTKDAAVAVAGSAVITKEIDMPVGLTDEDMESQITLEADQYIPFPLDEVALDFEIQGQKDEASNQMQVLLAACRRENIDSRTDVLEQAGLTPKVVDIEAYALERVSSLVINDWDIDAGQYVAIMDIGATVTTLSILHDHQIIYTREQLFGGNNLTEEIQRRYGLSQAEAEVAKVQGGLPEDYAAEVLEPFKDMALQQVTRSLQFFYSSGNYSQVDHIILAGGVAGINGLSGLVQDNLDTLVSVANPFLNMSVASKVDTQVLSDTAPGLMIATGLAMRSFV